MIRALAALFAVGIPLQATVAAQCDMAPAFAQPDRGGRSSISVWQDTNHSALLFADSMNVNTDGTRRSYSVSDFWGEASSNGAINNLCNAMSDACGGLTGEQMRGRRVLTQKARADNWPAQELSQTRISPSIIPFRNGKPCPEVDGFLVSATALHKAHMTDVCDISNYADALHTSAIVLPKRTHHGVATPFEARGAMLGDLVVVMSGDGKMLKYAVVGDSGPPSELGEISVALASDLLAKTEPPANYRQIRGKPPYQGQGWTVGNTYTLVFPSTRDAAQPYLTQDRIDAAVKPLFDRWGGVDRLKACAAVYKR